MTSTPVPVPTAEQAASPSPVTIYTDGACKGNPGPGGWGVVLLAGQHRRELCGAEPDTTNNRMELRAAIEGLRALNRRCRVTLVTDSAYVKNGITAWIVGWQRNGWRTKDKQPVKNAELWQELLTQTGRHDVAWRWTKGHANDAENNRCDELANQAIREAAPGLRGPA